MNLTLRNPHSILAAIQTRPQDVSRISLPASILEAGRDGTREDATDVWSRIAQAARSQRIALSTGGRHEQDRGSNRQPGRRGDRVAVEGGRVGVGEAVVAERASIPIEELVAGAKERAAGRGLWLALDSLQDPHNIGAIFRTAAFFGVQGIVLTQERSAPLSSTVYDIAAGGLEYVPFTLQINLQRAFEIAKESGLWVLGSSEHTGDDIRTLQPDRPWMLVLGNEENGMRRLTQEACDLLCRIPVLGGVTSLNVSVAAGILVSALSIGQKK